MKISVPKRAVKSDFVIIDSTFPQKKPFGFRNIEINEYLARIPSAEVYTMNPMEPWGDAWFPWSYGMKRDEFDENKSGYGQYYTENLNRVHYIDKDTKYRFKLAYSYFLAETYVLLPFYEKNKIPFVFMLYPGGTFGLNNKSSDNMIRRITSSPYFRGVITSQDITRHYLIDNELCDPDKISYIYGGFVQFDTDEVKPKKYYRTDKNTFDICFVAAKYSDKGVDKGYDLFIDTANELVKEIPDVRFHVVGNFDENDISVDNIRDKITFYGYQDKDFFLDFYAKMDILLSPNRPGKLYDGNFDGFPVGIDAGFCGTAMFVSDELDMNRYFTDNQDIVIIPLDAEKIAERILTYYNGLDELNKLSKKCQAMSQQLFSVNQQLKERMKIFNDVYQADYGRKLT